MRRFQPYPSRHAVGRPANHAARRAARRFQRRPTRPSLRLTGLPVEVQLIIFQKLFENVVYEPLRRRHGKYPKTFYETTGKHEATAILSTCRALYSIGREALLRTALVQMTNCNRRQYTDWKASNDHLQIEKLIILRDWFCTVETVHQLANSMPRLRELHYHGLHMGIGFPPGLPVDVHDTYYTVDIQNIRVRQEHADLVRQHARQIATNLPQSLYQPTQGLMQNHNCIVNGQPINVQWPVMGQVRCLDTMEVLRLLGIQRRFDLLIPVYVMWREGRQTG